MSVKYLELLETLSAHGVDFIVVGGVAAVLEGAPVSTLDLDILYDTRPDNLERLLAALRALGARFRDPAGRDLRPDLERLRTLRMGLLHTDLGPLDILARIGEDEAFGDLLEASVECRVGNLRLHVLGLAKLIEIKETTGRDKDRAILPVLRRTLELRGE